MVVYIYNRTLESVSLSVLSDSLQSMDYTPGSSIHGILQARILEWVTIPFSRGSPKPRDWTPGLLPCRWFLYQLRHQGSPTMEITELYKEHIYISPKGVNEPITYYTQWSKSQRERQISYINICIWNLKRWYRWTCLQGSSGDADTEKRLLLFLYSEKYTTEMWGQKLSSHWGRASNPHKWRVSRVG